MKLTAHFHPVQKLRSGGAIPVLLPYAFMADELYASFSAVRYCAFTDYGQSSGLVSKNRSTTGRTDIPQMLRDGEKQGMIGTSTSATYRLQKAYGITGLGKICTKANAKSLRATKYVLRHHDVYGEQKLQLLEFLIFGTRSGKWSSARLVRFTPKIYP